MEKEQEDSTVLIIRNEPIALHKLLKLGDMVASGGEAKYVVSAGLVKVNGVVQTQKGRKVFSGDVVEFSGVKIQAAEVTAERR